MSKAECVNRVHGCCEKEWACVNEPLQVPVLQTRAVFLNISLENDGHGRPIYGCFRPVPVTDFAVAPLYYIVEHSLCKSFVPPTYNASMILASNF